jgi:lipoprotein signal peptidase
VDRFKNLSLRSWGLYFLGFVLILFLDQYTKMWALETLPQINSASFPYGGWELARLNMGTLGSVEMAFVLAFNKGAAWSFLQDYPEFLLFIRVVLVFLLLLWLNFSTGMKRWAALMLLAGACSNLVDMFYRGAVIDMISFTFWGYPYPIFNFADMMICMGAICLMLLGVKPGEKA